MSDKRYEDLDRLQRPYGILTGGYRLDAPKWIMHVREYLTSLYMLEERYITEIEDESKYCGIIYATGAIGALVSNGLIPNKGEALIVKITDWKYPAVVKEDVFFVP